MPSKWHEPQVRVTLSGCTLDARLSDLNVVDPVAIGAADRPAFDLRGRVGARGMDGRLLVVAVLARCRFRSLGVRVMMDHEGRSMKNQMKQANKQKPRFALILGEDELAKREVALKDMDSGEQELVELATDFENWANVIKTKIK